eukprot:648206-Amphidinium_carterae.1
MTSAAGGNAQPWHRTSILSHRDCTLAAKRWVCATLRAGVKEQSLKHRLGFPNVASASNRYAGVCRSYCA